jgi:hypothetical protein
VTQPRLALGIGAAAAGGFLLTPLLFFAPAPASAAASTPAVIASGGTVAPPLLGSLVRTPAALLPGVPTGGYPDSFPNGQCTYWAALNHRVTWSGDAGEWLANAAAQGVPTTAVPSLGAIAVWPAGAGYDARHGHVAVVTAVAPTSYTVSEMNYLGEGVVDARTISWPDGRVLGFIP